MKMKRVLSAALSAAVFLGGIGTGAYAYTFPKAFWAAQDSYAAAMANGDNMGIIRYGNEIISIMSGASAGEEKNNVMVDRYNNIAKAYEAIGDYAGAAASFEALVDYAEPLGSKYLDYIKGAKEKALQYAPRIAMYTDGGVSPYYGAKNEKKNGVLFGLCQNGETRSKLKNESMVLIYQEFGQALLPYNAMVFGESAEKGLAIEFALNCPNEGGDIRNFASLSNSLYELSDLFAKYPSTPVYLRFGAEFDVWTDMATPEQFIDVFRTVSQFFKERNSNVAIVWSPNQVSGWDTDTDAFYPGDEYVDWVGMSLYAQRYFLGDPYADKDSEIFFRTGLNSDPVLAVKHFIDTYGDRKPIMISESGCGHRMVHSGEDTSDFAVKRLREYYSYLPMVYPQIKLMAYFDYYLDSYSEKSDFRLSTNSTLQSEYIRITNGDRFLHGGYSADTGVCWQPVYNGLSVGGVFPVSCYTHMYGTDATAVNYYIDGEFVASANSVPFTAYIDADSYSGAHTLKAVASFADGSSLVSQANVYINGKNSDIKVTISGNDTVFDQKPVIYNGRTMVPMRKIFEDLGAVVSWDGATQTAQGTRNGRTVSVTVGSNIMTVNGEEKSLDVSPFLLSGRTLVPARAIAEGLGCNVDWDGATSTVIITEK